MKKLNAVTCMLVLLGVGVLFNLKCDCAINQSLSSMLTQVQRG